MEIVTGSTGNVHVTPIDDAVRNGNVGYVNSKVVFNYLQNFEAAIITNNEVRIYSGYGMNQGRYFKIDRNEYDAVTVTNGSAGYKRADFIVARYTRNTQSGFEDISLVCLRGNSGNAYVDPTAEEGLKTGNVNGDDTEDDFVLYRVRINGTTIEGLDQMFTVLPDGGRLGQLENRVTAHENAYNAMNIRTNLASESTAYPKNGANVRPGVEGILPVAHGGTGRNTLKAGANDLVGSLDTNGSTPSDSDYYVGTTPGVAGYHRKPFTALWNWILSKIRTQLGMSTNDVVPVSHGGTGKTSVGSGKLLVGNAGGGFDEKGTVTTLANATHNDFPTAKAVSDAMSNAGYGDMLKSTYDPNQDGIIAPAQGGTGNTSLQATRNAMGLGNTSGALPIANGGTGAATAALARNNLGLGNTTGALPIANGGTGASDAATARANLGLGNVNNTADSQKSVNYAASAGTANSVAWSNVTNKPSAYTPTSHTDTAGAYGVATRTTFGHLKLGDTEQYKNTSSLPGYTAAPIQSVQNLWGLTCYFAGGHEYENGVAVGAYGIITSSGTALRLYVPMGRITLGAFTYMAKITIDLRKPSGGYLIASDADVTQYYTSSKLMVNNVMQINLTKEDGWGVTNNTIVIGEINLWATLWYY